MPKKREKRKMCEFMSEASMFTRQRNIKEQLDLRARLGRLESQQKKTFENFDIESRSLKTENEQRASTFSAGHYTERKRTKSSKSGERKIVYDNDDEGMRRRYSISRPTSPFKPYQKDTVLTRSKTFNIEMLHSNKERIVRQGKFIDSVVKQTTANFIPLIGDSTDKQRLFWSLTKLRDAFRQNRFPRLEKENETLTVRYRRYSSPESKAPPLNMSIDQFRLQSLQSRELKLIETKKQKTANVAGTSKPTDRGVASSDPRARRDREAEAKEIKITFDDEESEQKSKRGKANKSLESKTKDKILNKTVRPDRGSIPGPLRSSTQPRLMSVSEDISEILNMDTLSQIKPRVSISQDGESNLKKKPGLHFHHKATEYQSAINKIDLWKRASKQAVRAYVH